MFLDDQQKDFLSQDYKIRWSSSKSSIQCFDCPTKLMTSADCEMRQWSLVKKWRSLFYDVPQ